VIGRELRARGRDHTQLFAAAKEERKFYLSSLSCQSYSFPLVYSVTPGVSASRKLLFRAKPGEETYAYLPHLVSFRFVSFRFVSFRLVSSRLSERRNVIRIRVYREFA